MEVEIVKGSERGRKTIAEALGKQGFSLRVLTDAVVREVPTAAPRRKVLRRFSPPPARLEGAFATLDAGTYVVQLVGLTGMVIASVKAQVRA